MDARRLALWRMHTMRLAGPPCETPEDAVGSLVAVQAQDFIPAQWSVAMRSRAAAGAALERLFAEGRILRTHLLRPTWHFVLPADIRWLLLLTAPRVQASNAYRQRQLELDEKLLARADTLLVSVLEGGSQLTRARLSAVLSAAGINTEGQRMAYILMHAELNGLICSGAPQGRQQTYALLDERAPGARTLARDEALAELTLRYFTGHGPATAKDFRWWSSLTLNDIGNGLEAVGSHLEQESIDGLTYWFAEPPPRRQAPSPTVQLVQGYDEYIVGYGESRLAVDLAGRAASRIFSRPAYAGAVIVDGQIAGHWKQAINRGSIVLDVELYAPLDAAQVNALHAAGDRYGGFLGLPASLTERPLRGASGLGLA